ncbi:hypothetical protein [Fodinibius roseus]|uniref:hypothetical protein n=1 Tax=Fodinibius roseus TaxID=1194090 RepID=UPI00147F5BE7|nr:hypothetical protein [Fodinibius roseus]
MSTPINRRFTESKTPVVQQLDEHRYVAAGLSGMGIAIGMEVGRSAAEMIGGKYSDRPG